jgi:very-short-patch-repair endonuclease
MNNEEYDELVKVEERKRYFAILHDLKEFYTTHEKYILDLAKRSPTQWYQSYIVDYNKFFSPIERMAWNCMRTKGGVVLYPQYPVGKYFIDFGNPHFKIALELDGKEFHKDFAKDRERDLALSDLGWITYRVSGTEMTRTNHPEYLDLENFTYQELSHWLFSTGDGVIEAIKHIHFKKITVDHSSDEAPFREFIGLCEKSLDLHKKGGR